MFKWLRKLFGVEKYSSLDQLAKLVKPGDLARLNHYVSNIWYKADKTLNDEWQDVEQILSRDKKECDCEEKAIIRAAIINLWMGYEAQILVVIYKDNPDKNHAVCIYWKDRFMGYMDDGGYSIYPRKTSFATIIRENWPTATYCFFASPKGKKISENMYI